MSYQIPTGVNAGLVTSAAGGAVVGLTSMFILACVLMALGMAFFAIAYGRREDTGV